MLLYIIRHGDPDYATDSLTPKGLLQAEAVGQRLFHANIDKIFTSPMGRAKQTAEPACRLLGLTSHIEPWAHEIEDEMMVNFPDGQRKPLGGVQNSCFLENGGIHLPYDEALKAPGFNESSMGSAMEYIQDGGRDFLLRLGYKEEASGVYRILQPSDERIALFCHAALARTWISHLLHIPIHLMFGGFNYCHTGVTILEFKNFENGFTAPKCLCYSDLSHFIPAGLEMVYNNYLPI